MIKSIKIANVGPITSAECQKLGKINLFVGHNGRGKTHMLKMIYASVWSVEQYKRGIEKRSMAQLLGNKLDTTFMPKKIGDIVTKGEQSLEVYMTGGEGECLKFSFGKDTTNSIANVENTFATRSANSIFIPAKEVISLQGLIKESRGTRYNEPYFDDTYKDLADALTPAAHDRCCADFTKVRDGLTDAIHGRIEYDAEKKEWYFKDEDNRKISIFLTSEGVKKMSILDVLLSNNFLTEDSVVFIDEIESALHPLLISQFLELLASLAKMGIQFFIATHSYTVIKKLYIIANREEMSIPCLSFDDEKVVSYDLKEGMPENEIVNESIKLYEEELDL